MKTRFTFQSLFSLFLVTILLFSCKKEEVIPSNFHAVYDEKSPNPINTVWTLYSAKVFVENMAKNTFAYYDHFGGTKVESNLDIFSPSFLAIDNIIENGTTWEFNTTKVFTLNNNLRYDYTVSDDGRFIRVIGLENGSSRVIEIISGSDGYMSFKINENYGNDSLDNYNFYTIVTFRSNTGVTPTEPAVPYGYTYNGVVDLNSTPPPTLSNSVWVLTNYFDNLTFDVIANDTLEFISETQYTWNGSNPKNYSLSSIVGNNTKNLSLYSLPTLGGSGDWSGQVQASFITDGVIYNATFVDIVNVGSNKKVFMQRIQ
jgi:hypothetical protein